MKRIFVTGGSGFIGAGVINELVKDKYKIICFDNYFRGGKDKFSKNTKGIKFVKGDVRDLRSLIKYSKNCDMILHLAFINGTKYFYEKPDLVLDVGVKGMINVIEATKINKIRELIVASSSEVYQTPEVVPTLENERLIVPDVHNPRYSYGGGKIISELLSLHACPHLKRVIIFRPHNVYGPNMGNEHVIPEFLNRLKKLINNNKNKGPINFKILGDGNQIRAFNFISDFAEGVKLLIKKGKHKNIYHIGDDRKYKIKDIIKELSKIHRIKIKIINKRSPVGETKVRCPNINKMRKLGYKPKINIKKGLKITSDWYFK